MNPPDQNPEHSNSPEEAKAPEIAEKPARPEKPEWWDKVSTADFDGRSQFRDLTPAQKLMWLSQLQRFVATAKGAARREAGE